MVDLYFPHFNIQTHGFWPPEKCSQFWSFWSIKCSTPALQSQPSTWRKEGKADGFILSLLHEPRSLVKATSPVAGWGPCSAFNELTPHFFLVILPHVGSSPGREAEGQSLTVGVVFQISPLPPTLSAATQPPPQQVCGSQAPHFWGTHSTDQQLQ